MSKRRDRKTAWGRRFRVVVMVRGKKTLADYGGAETETPVEQCQSSNADSRFTGSVT